MLSRKRKARPWSRTVSAPNDGQAPGPEKPAAPMAEATGVEASVAALSVVPEPVSVDTGTREKTEPAADSEPESAAS